MTARRPSSGELARHRPPRCYAPDLPGSPASLELTSAEAHHLSAVLRLGVGDEVELFDGRGGSAWARIVLTGRGRVVVETGPVRLDPPPGWTAALLQGLPKNEARDLVVRIATELGAARMVFVHAQRTVGRPSPADVERLISRWHAVAVAAAKQCGRNRLPELGWAPSVEAAVEGGWTGLSLAGEAGGPPLRDRLAPAAAGGCRAIRVALGPEGGFDPAERAALERAGFVPFRLGPHILRTETAAVAVLAALAYELDRPAGSGSAVP